ncbi:hypothetical protein I3271_03265 [Photobacterium leiognathi]|uniref:flagellar hook-associated protein FlgK n=1 Tax=Photobacterium leiognathi TaxID=553611 RepID=UPI001EDFE59F|nr:hypothetical protein [Photobacterium leiognathi]MCG3883701.1 hypothetical protein [Photobacterium leiognathi]
MSSKNIQHAADANFARETVRYTTGTGGQLIINIQRMSDSFLSTRLNQATSRNAADSSAYQSTSQIDKLITSSTMTSEGKYENLLQSSITQMSSSWDGLLVKDTPSARKSIIADLDQVRININDMANSLQQQQKLINNQIKASTDESNEILKQVAELNDLISKTDPGDTLNDLLNKQSALIYDLSVHLDINSRFSNDGTARIELKSGMTLVDGKKYRDIEVGSSEFSNDYSIFVNGKKVSDNPELLGGTVGGQLMVRDGELAEAQRKLGLMSASMVNVYNNANRQGFTADGEKGKDILTPITAGALSSSNNIGDSNLFIKINPDDTKQLTAEPLKVVKTPTGYEVYNNNSDTLISSFSDLPLKVNGMEISLSTGVVMAGDEFLIDPLRVAASKFEVIAGPDDIAISANHPVVSGDNGNIQNFISARDEKIMFNGTATISEGLATIYVDISINSATALSRMQTSKSIHDSASGEWGAYSGVNLEEERISLLGYEKNYQAASKIVQSSQKMWSSILDVIG